MGSYIDILIPVWNNLKYTHRCITSILHGSGGMNFKLTIINNNSTDGTCQYLDRLKKHSWVNVINNNVNLGWISGLNQGIKATNGKYVIFMNNDVVVSDGWIQKLLSPLNNPDIGACGPINSNDHDWQYFGRVREKLVYDLPKFDNPNNLKECNKILEDKYGSTFLRIRGMLAFFCVAFRRETIKRVGLLDKRFGVGLGDDDDYARRLEQSGLELALALSCYVIHHSKATFKIMFNDDEYEKLRKHNLSLLKEKYPERY